MDGIILIDKPKKMTSHHVVVKLRYGFRIDKVGHGGTLDPLATGLMVILVGRGVKMSEYVLGHQKSYRVTGVFGQMRDTYDEFGKVVSEDDTVVSREQLEKVIAEFPRVYNQAPPAYSAKKIAGVPAYKKAREGKVTELPEKEVEISQLDLVSFDFPRFELLVTVTSGTYIRSLIVDIAQKAGTVAYVEELRRLTVGQFSLENAYPLDDVLTWPKEKFLEIIRPMEESVMELPAVDMTIEQRDRFVCGQWILAKKVEDLKDRFRDFQERKQLLRIRADGEFFAVGYVEEDFLKAEKVLLRYQCESGEEE